MKRFMLIQHYSFHHIAVDIFGTKKEAMKYYGKLKPVFQKRKDREQQAPPAFLGVLEFESVDGVGNDFGRTQFITRPPVANRSRKEAR